MANAFFDSGRQALLTGAVFWTSSPIGACLVKSTYTPDFATHATLADINPSTNVVARTTVSGCTVVNGVCNALSISFSAVPAGTDIPALLIYKNTGVDATSILICYIDAGFPVTPTGADIQVFWDSGPNKIFRL